MCRGAIIFPFKIISGGLPYNEETGNTSDKPVYNILMEAAHKVADKTILITPARFLFDAGKTPKDFNQRMLNDPHFKFLDYAPDARKYFSGVEIKGGVAVTLYDNTRTFEPIGTFLPFPELNSVLSKIRTDNFQSLDDLIFPQNKWNLEKLFEEHPECKSKIGSGGTERRLTTAIFSAIDLFREHGQNGDIKILGLIKNQRVYRYIEEKYIDARHENLRKYKALLPASNGSGALGEVVSTPLVGYTQSFISFGAFDTEAEAIYQE